MYAGVDPGTIPIGIIANSDAYSGGGAQFAADCLRAAIDWGDSTTQTSASINYNANDNDFEVSGNHVYSGSGDYTIAVFITINDTDQVYFEDPLTVHDVAGSGGSGDISLSLPGTQGNNEGDTAGFNVSANTADGDNIVHYSISGQPAGISIDDNGHISGTIDPAASLVNYGSYSVIVTAQDSNGDEGSATFPWLVSASPTVVYNPGRWYDTAGSSSFLPIYSQPITANTTIAGYSMTGTSPRPVD